MKVLHFSALDGETGAGIAAARLHEGLLERGVDSRFCVAHPALGLKNAFTPPVSLFGRVTRRAEYALDRWMMRKAAAGYDYVLSSGACGFDIGEIVRAEKPDVVQLHWIGGSTFRFSSLAGIGVPVVWFLADQWAFCGVEHLQPEPDKYVTAPRRVNALQRRSRISEHVRRSKRATYAQLRDLTLVCPSHWLARETKSSALLGNRPVELIPTGCDTELFAMKDRLICRAALGLPPDAPIILAGATSMATQWKGLDLFVEAAARLSASSSDLPRPHIVTFGKDPFDAAPLGGRADVTHLGQIRDRRLMAILYGAADVFAAPSRMENLSNAVLESLACGTPVVAFAIGGMPDMIDHQVNGYLAAPFDTSEFADGLRFALLQRDRPGIRLACRQTILSRFSREQEIEKYIALYQRLLSPQTVPHESRVSEQAHNAMSGEYNRA